MAQSNWVQQIQGEFLDSQGHKKKNSCLFFLFLFFFVCLFFLLDLKSGNKDVWGSLQGSAREEISGLLQISELESRVYSLSQQWR